VFRFRRVSLHEFGSRASASIIRTSGARNVSALMNSKNRQSRSLTAMTSRRSRALRQGPTIVPCLGANLVNLSTRAFIGTGEQVMIGGFIIQDRSRDGRFCARSVIVGSERSVRHETRTQRSSSGAAWQTQFNDDWVDDGTIAQTIASYGLDRREPRGGDDRDVAAGQLHDDRARLRGRDGVGLVELYDLHTTHGRAGNISTRARVGSGNDVMVAGLSSAAARATRRDSRDSARR
jgi:hypothetical protein